MSVLKNLLEKLRSLHLRRQAQRPYKRRLKVLEGKRQTIVGRISEIVTKISSLQREQLRLESKEAQISHEIESTQENLDGIQ